jgi:hypothetical protein
VTSSIATKTISLGGCSVPRIEKRASIVWRSKESSVPIPQTRNTNPAVLTPTIR